MTKIHKIVVGLAIVALVSLTAAFAFNSINAVDGKKAAGDCVSVKSCCPAPAKQAKCDAAAKTCDAAAKTCCPVKAACCCGEDCKCCDGCETGKCACEDCKCCDCCKK